MQALFVRVRVKGRQAGGLAQRAEGNALGQVIRKILRPERAFQKRSGLPFQGERSLRRDTEGVALGYDGRSLSGSQERREKQGLPFAGPGTRLCALFWKNQTAGRVLAKFANDCPACP